MCNRAINVKEAIDAYAKSYEVLQKCQEENSPLIPIGDQKTGCIGEFYAYLYLHDRYSSATLTYEKPSKKGCDIIISSTENGPTTASGTIKTCKVQVKTVSDYAKKRVISPIHHGWDLLYIIFLDKSFSPQGFWIVTDCSIVSKKSALKGLICPHPKENKGGSTKRIKFGDNLIENLQKSIDKYISKSREK